MEDLNQYLSFKKVILNRFVIILFLVMFANISIAKTIPIFASLDLSQVFTAPGSTQQVALFNDLGNTYVADNNVHNILSFMAGVGATTFQNNHIKFDDSVRFMPIGNVPVSGYVWELYSPLYANLAYKYRLKSDILLFENAISWIDTPIHPSFILGFGRAINRVSYYDAYPLNNNTIIAAQKYKNNKTIQVAYEIGVGLDYKFNKAVIELAYRFVNVGKANLGLSPTQTTTDTLSTGQINYHTVNLGARFYYDWLG